MFNRFSALISEIITVRNSTMELGQWVPQLYDVLIPLKSKSINSTLILKSEKCEYVFQPVQ